MKMSKQLTSIVALLLAPLAVVGVLVATHLAGTPAFRAKPAAAAQPGTAPAPALTAKDVFVKAVSLLQTVGVPPNASVDRVPTAADVQQMEQRGKAALSRVFASTAIGE